VAQIQESEDIMSSAPSLLEAKSISMQFGGIKALTDFSLSIQPKDLQGLIGPNGAGKTTAFNVLTGVYQATRGELFVCDEKNTGWRPFQINQAGVARTFQNIRLFKEMTAFDNVRVAISSTRKQLFDKATMSRLRRNQGSSKFLGLGGEALSNYVGWFKSFFLTSDYLEGEKETSETASRMLEVMGLSHRSNELAKNLPYGEQRRLEIARALGTKPKVLLLDEPAAGMNTREKSDLMGLIQKIRDDFQLGILVIEHDMKLVMGICEKLTVLDHGETIATGTPKEVRENSKVIEAYLGEVKQ
jgi:branched-chain amino acid transport system ATP-binding protein